MINLLVLSAALLQEPPAPPAPPSPPEVRFMMMGPHGHGAMDRDGDGQVTREEFTAPMAEAFARMDRDGDGRLSGEELAARHGDGAHDVMIRRGGEPGMHRFEMRRSHGPAAPGERHEFVIRGPGGEGGPHVFHFDSAEGPAHRMDADGDGRVSEAEFTARLREAFARMDADRSGFLEESERGGNGEVRVITRRVERDGAE